MKAAFVPNAVTCLNLLSGCAGVLFALKGEHWNVFCCVLAAGAFDFLDGTLARVLRAKSELGKQLDSLADMVSFGFLPGCVLYALLAEASGSAYWPYIGFLVTVFSALRLAKFNIDERQTTDFIGLNTPMNTFFVVSLPFVGKDHPVLAQDPWILTAVVALCCFLLVSEIRLFSMKLSSLGWKENRFKYIFLLLSAVSVVSLGFLAVPVVLALYVLLSKMHFRQEL